MISKKEISNKIFIKSNHFDIIGILSLQYEHLDDHIIIIKIRDMQDYRVYHINDKLKYNPYENLTVALSEYTTLCNKLNSEIQKDISN